MVFGHTTHKAIEHFYRRHHIGALVEHHALGAASHGCIRHFAARRQAFCDEAFEHLRRPDGRYVCRLAQPQNFLLHFSEPRETDFYGKVTAGDHDRQWLPPGSLNDNLR